MRTILLLVLAACASNTVELSGTVFNGPNSTLAAPNTRVALLDPDGGLLAETTTDGEGRFVVDVEAAINVFAELSASGARNTSFAGVVGIEDSYIPDGTLYTVSETVAADVEALFRDCPGTGGEGLVLGEVRQFDVVDQNGEAAINLASRVTLLLEDGGSQTACYYDDDGVAYEPGALLNGPSGGFVLPNVPAGLHTLEIVYNATVDVTETQEYPVWVGQKATLSPWYPAYVTLAGL